MTTDTSEVDSFLSTTTTPALAPPPIPEAPKKKKRSKEPRTQAYSSLNLSFKMLPPLTRRRTAIYELLDIDKVDPRVIDGPRIVEIPPYQMSPIYKIYDRFEPDMAKRMKTMVYSDEINVQEYHNSVAKNIDPGVNMKLDMPEFVNGQVIVDCEAQYIKHVWWELHPRNLSNKFRNKEQPGLFRRVDVEFRSPHLELLRMDLANDAEKVIIKLNHAQLINLASAFGIPATYPQGDMRLDMRKRARAKPEEVLFKTPDARASTFMNVMSALDLGIIDFKPETQEYFFPNEEESFFVVPLDQTPLEALANFLISEDGQEEKAMLEDILSFWK